MCGPLPLTKCRQTQTLGIWIQRFLPSLFQKPILIHKTIKICLFFVDNVQWCTTRALGPEDYNFPFQLGKRASLFYASLETLPPLETNKSNN